MRTPALPLALAASLLCAPSAFALSEFGIEGMGVVSTKADETRASVSVDGQRIVWASADRAGGPSGGDLWQATLRDGRWADAQPLPAPLNTPGADTDPFFSADGRWLYFASDRAGGHGGGDLYRAPVLADGRYGPPQNLGAAVNSRGDERTPALSLDGTRLLFASDGHGGAGGMDLFVARLQGQVFGQLQALDGIDSADDETDAAWLGDGRALVFARARKAQGAQVWLAQCAAGRYVQPQPLALSFNGADGDTRGAVLDASKPSELLVVGSARAPKAGQRDVYRMKAPAASGSDDCAGAR
ncbi:TolB-like protein [Xanthomonas sp. NCPPB 2654]|uniref:TolB family protein n=1 Tax=unclassified Xanthomonas TaxID=2643310 RepID=UPI0021E094DE|nr:MULTISPECIES: TolB-like protein [unclassified Xanthomonas]MDL5364302.1 TolB-like protein [Xanthomonas sp. NCPPB 2654]UYC20403.1 TolB-like protein [Xanthomonas sp. CFBP 8443]